MANVGEIEYTVSVETQGSINAAQQFDKQMHQVQGSARKTDKELGKLDAGFSKLATAIKGVIAVSALRSMAGMVQQYQAMSERVRMATTSTEEFELVQRRLQATADGTYRNLAEAQEVYINTSAGLKDMGYNAEQTLDIVDSLSYAFVSNATSSDAANAALNALTRAVNRGTVQSERWATIYNAVPTILDDIAAATGRPREELSRLGYEGKLSTDLLTEALLKAKDANKEAADSMSTDLVDAAVRSRNALTTFLVNLENQTGVIQAVTDGIIAASEALLEFGQDAEKVETFLTFAKVAGASLAAVMAGRLLTSIGLSTAALYTNVVAAQRAAGAMSVATVAAKGLRTAMAFLGGPVGVAMLAGVAIYSFASASRKAAPPTDDLTKSVSELNAAQRELAEFEATKRLEELGEKSRVLADNLKYAEERMGSGRKQSRRYTEDVLKMRVEQGKLNKEIGIYRKRLEDLQNYQAPVAPEEKGKTPQPTTTTEEGQKRLQAMRDEIELSKQVGVARARLAAVQRMGADATTEEREEAERLATELYRLEKSQEAAKKATEEARNAAKSDKDVLAELTEQLYQTTLEADELRKRQAELQLSSYATDDQVAEVHRLVQAISEAEQKAADLEQRKQAFGTDVAGAITGSTSPLSGGMFDDQTARYEAEAQAEQQRYADAMARLQEAKALELEVKGGYMALEEQMAQEHADRMAQIEKAKNEMMMTQAADAFGSMASNLQDYITTFGSENKELMAMMKASAIAQTIIQTYQGAQQAFTSLSSIPYVGPALGAAAAAAAIAGGMARVASIRAQGTRRHGGTVSPGSMYRVNEGGAPEVFQNNLGQQYMIPNSRGEVISNKDASGSGGGGVVINIHNAPQGTNAESSEGPDGEQMIDIWIADFTSDGRTASVVQNKFGLSAQGR